PTVNNFTSLSHLSLTKVTCGSLEPYFGSTSEIVDVGRLFSLTGDRSEVERVAGLEVPAEEALNKPVRVCLHGVLQENKCSI
ncbi:uncharacterized protein LAESUDRAFT_731314, partial [Laetiporus sulphureus 93-53]